MNFVWSSAEKKSIYKLLQINFSGGGPTGWYFVEKQSTPIGQGFKTLKTDCLLHMKPSTTTPTNK